MADEPGMEFFMLLANVIVCLQLNFALYNTLMSSYRKEIAVLRSLVSSGPSPGPIRARRLSGNDKKQAWLLKQTPSMRKLLLYVTLLSDQRFSVDSRIRYENGIVWTRIDRCVFDLTKTHTFENAWENVFNVIAFKYKKRRQ